MFDQLAGRSLIQSTEYEQAFADARSQPQVGPLAVPWDVSKPYRIQYFWTYYFGNVSPHLVQPLDAWRKLVPLRRPAGMKVKAAWLPGSVRFHAFHYPHALALVALVDLKADLSIGDAVDKAQEIGHFGEFDATFDNDPTVRQNTLAGLAAETQDRMRAATFGPAFPVGEKWPPFSLATVVQAEGGPDDGTATPENSDLHHALDGFCTGHRDWRQTPPIPLQQAKISTRRAPASHLLYGLNRGRVVWFPSSFLPNERRLYTLGCYHHNLLFASLQTDCLLALIAMADHLGDLNRLSPPMQTLVRSGADLTGRLYKGDSTCYRSQSPRRQIDDSARVNVVNRVRQFYGGMAPL
jgi:hypothetical protein